MARERTLLRAILLGGCMVLEAILLRLLMVVLLASGLLMMKNSV